MAIVASGQTTIMDMNDAIISGTAPTSPLSVPSGSIPLSLQTF